MMVQFAGVSKWYDNHIRVLDHVNLELKKGEFLYVVGGSGAGKSTLLRILATQEAPCEGSLSLFGYRLNEVSSATLQAIRRMVGFIPQNVRLIEDLTVFENVALSLSLAGRKATTASSRAKVMDSLERLGLAAKKDDVARTLSGGEAQRVAVARALVRSPELIVADEPTGAQDWDHTWSIMDLFLKASLGGTTVVVATHDREIVRRVRKRSATLKAGRLAVEEAMCIF